MYDWQKKILDNMCGSYNSINFDKGCCQSEPDEKQPAPKWEAKATTNKGPKILTFKASSRNAALGRAKDILIKEDYDFFHIDSIKEVRE